LNESDVMAVRPHVAGSVYGDAVSSARALSGSMTAFFEEVASLTTGRKQDMRPPEVVRERIVALAHAVVDADASLLLHKHRGVTSVGVSWPRQWSLCGHLRLAVTVTSAAHVLSMLSSSPLLARGVHAGCFIAVEQHEERRVKLKAAKERLVTARAELAAVSQRAHAAVADLEDALFEARQELARPRAVLSPTEVLQLAQRMGYVTAAPLGWQVRPPLCPCAVSALHTAHCTALHCTSLHPRHFAVLHCTSLHLAVPRSTFLQRLATLQLDAHCFVLLRNSLRMYDIVRYTAAAREPDAVSALRAQRTRVPRLTSLSHPRGGGRGGA
jgi:hypothetical protein